MEVELNETVNSQAEDIPSSVNESGFSKKLVWFIAGVILIVTLSFGLIPRGSFSENWVDWSEDDQITRFGSYGLVHGQLPELGVIDHRLQELEFVLDFVPVKSENGPFLVFVEIENREDKQPFIIGQWRTSFIVMQGLDFSNKLKLPRLGVDLSDHMGSKVNLKIKLREEKNELFLNGKLVSAHEPSGFNLTKENASISIGNSSDGKHGWEGQVSNFEIWTEALNGSNGGVLRKYEFAANSLPEITDSSPAQNHLVVPKPGRFPGSIFLHSISVDKLMKLNLTDAIVNVVGFMPIGFALFYFFSVSKVKSSYFMIAVKTLAVGALVSLSIEFSQQYIPGRFSHLHDLLFNCIGLVLAVVISGLIYLGIMLVEYFKVKRLEKEASALLSSQPQTEGIQADGILDSQNSGSDI